MSNEEARRSVMPDAPPGMPTAPNPVNAVVVISAAIIGMVTIIGVVALAIARPTLDVALVASILAAGGSLVGAILALTATRGVQVVHQMMNSRLSELLAETKRRATAEAQLIERTAADAASRSASMAAMEATRLASEAAARAAVDVAAAVVAAQTQAPLPPPTDPTTAAQATVQAAVETVRAAVETVRASTPERQGE